jgi:TolB protein
LLRRSAKLAGASRTTRFGRLAGIGLLILTVLWVEAGIVLETAFAEGPAIVITPGQERAFRAAVQTFQDEDGLSADPERAKKLRSVIEDGLSYSGVLQPLPEEAFLGESATQELDEKRFDCGDWTQSGADALVEGRIFRQGQETAVEYQVWDTARCTRVGQGVIAEAPKNETRLGKRVADGIVEAFTGTPGVASTELAFISDRSGAREVWVMDANGDRQRQATRGSSLKQFPDWMPDGGAILYTSYPERSGLPRLYLTSRGEYRPGPLLTRVLPDAPKYRGVFGPEGRYLALVTSIGGQAELFRVDRSGRDLHRLTRSSAIDISPAWSPDGQQIAFVSDRSGAPQIYIMDRNGGNVRRITYNGSYNTSPAWSPDGRWIAYETRVEAQFDLWLIDPAGEVNLPIVSHGRSDESPAWSPDSRKIAFSSTRRGRPDIYVVDADGKNLKRLTRGQGQNLQPAWGPFAR